MLSNGMAGASRHPSGRAPGSARFRSLCLALTAACLVATSCAATQQSSVGRGRGIRSWSM